MPSLGSWNALTDSLTLDYPLFELKAVDKALGAVEKVDLGFQVQNH